VCSTTLAAKPENAYIVELAELKQCSFRISLTSNPETSIRRIPDLILELAKLGQLLLYRHT